MSLQPPLDMLGQPLAEDLGEVDVAMLQSNLRLTPDERLLRHEQWLDFIYELRSAGKQVNAAQTPGPRVD